MSEEQRQLTLLRPFAIQNVEVDKLIDIIELISWAPLLLLILALIWIQEELMRKEHDDLLEIDVSLLKYDCYIFNRDVIMIMRGKQVCQLYDLIGPYIL